MASNTAMVAAASDSDLRRFALCFLFTRNRNSDAIDWEAASAAYDPKIKVNSFKVVTNRAIARLTKAEGGDGTTSPTKKAGGGRKRKADAEGDDEGEADAAAAPTKKRKAAGAKGKKGKSATPVEEDAADGAEADVKTEETEEGESGDGDVS